MAFIEGFSRAQLALTNLSFDDVIAPDNPVRFIDGYVDTFDVSEFGISASPKNTGRPGFNPKTLLKLYLYGYLQRIRSSRRLEAEACRNCELIWLLQGLKPDHRTISDFRKNNCESLRRVFRAFLVFCTKQGLLSLETVGVDGTKLRAQNHLSNVFNRADFAKIKQALDDRIAAYIRELDVMDQTRTPDQIMEPEKISGALEKLKSMEALKKRLKAMKKRQSKLVEIEAKFAENPDVNQIMATDSDARMMKGGGAGRPGYNAQIAVDAKHKIIVAAEVTNEANDMHQLAPMTKAVVEVKNELGLHTETVIEADAGYHTRQSLQQSQEIPGVTLAVAVPRENPRPHNKNSIPTLEYRAEEFQHDKERDVLICPEGKELKLQRTLVGSDHPTQGAWSKFYRGRECGACQKRSLCTKGAMRIVRIGEYHDFMEAFRMKMKTPRFKAFIGQRKELCEHPFGTLKRTWGYGYFLLRGFEKVRGEFSLQALAYNLRRCINILGVPAMVQALQSSSE